MKHLAVVGILLLATTTSAYAQAALADEGRQVWGYVFTAPAIGGAPTSEQFFHWGGGVEWRFRPRIGLAADMGALHFGDSPAYPLFILSIDGSYHFRDQSARALVPFVTAGYSGASLVAGLDMPWANAGVGVNYWLRNGKGFLAEARYQVTRRGAGCYGEGPCRNWFVESRAGFNF
jgi:hypothetical protein